MLARVDGPGWSVQEMPSGDRSAVATENIAEGAVVCRVPRACAWTVTAQHPPSIPESYLRAGYWQSKDVQSVRGWYLKLAAKLLYEKHLGEGSKWSSYIAMLPPHVDTLVHWSDQELRQLQSPRLQVSIAASR
jgi:hypothetical protein